MKLISSSNTCLSSYLLNVQFAIKCCKARKYNREPTRPDGRCDMRLSGIVLDKYHNKEAFVLVKYTQRCV